MQNSPEIALKDRFRLRRGLILETIDDEVVVLDTEGDQYFGLNPVGAAVLRSFEKGGTVADAVDAVLEQFDVGDDTARGDVVGFIVELRDAELVRRADDED